MNENPTARTGLGVRSRAWVVVALAAAPALAACSGTPSVQEAAAARVADAFLTAVAAQPDSACALLAPGTRQEVEDTAGSCAEGLDEVDAAGAGRVADVEVYGLDAIVRLENDTVFLAFFDNGWLVTAAGCTPEAPERPFTCDVKGG